MKARSQIYSLIIFFMKKKDYTVTIISVVGLFLLTLMLIVAVTPERKALPPIIKFAHKAMTRVDYGGRAHIGVIDQFVAGKVIILSLALKESGYVVIHKEEKGKPGKIIGVSKILAPGLYTNNAIDLGEGVASGERLVAMLHSDDGDGVFSVETDTPTKGDEMTMMGGSGMVRFMAI